MEHLVDLVHSDDAGVVTVNNAEDGLVLLFIYSEFLLHLLRLGSEE